ncbi:MAG: AEC family transporter [Luteibaculaceae bacterium]
MENFLLIIICLLSGILLKRYANLPHNASIVINTIIIFFCLPAVALLYVPNMIFNPEILLPFFSSFLVWFGAWALFSFLGKLYRWDTTLTTTLILLAGLGNTSFVGFPLVEAYYGSAYIGKAIFADQAGFLIVSTFAVFLAVKASGGSISTIEITKKLLFFPPFIAFLIALALRFVNLPDWFFTLQTKLSAPLVPLAMISVGMQLNFKEKFTQWKYLSVGLAYKLVFAPLLVFTLYFFALNNTSMEAQIGIFEAAMAPMVTAFILVQRYQLKPDLAGMMVGIGIPLSLLTTFFWFLLLNQF